MRTFRKLTAPLSSETNPSLPCVMKNGWRRVGMWHGDLLDIQSDTEDSLLGAARRQHLPSFQSPPHSRELLLAAFSAGVMNSQPAIRQNRQLEGMDKRDVTRVREVRRMEYPLKPNL